MDEIQITEELLRGHEHIPDRQIETDIADTQREMGDLEHQINAYEELSICGPVNDRKMASFRRDAARLGIEERSVFIRKLQALLEARHKSNVPS